MTALPVSPFENESAPEPMAALTNRIISPKNIAKEVRLRRAKPLGRWALRRLQGEVRQLEKQAVKLAVGEDEDINRFTELRQGLMTLQDYKLELVQKRDAAPDDPHLKNQWDELHREALPLHKEYVALRSHLKELQILRRRVAAIQQQIAENPEVILRHKAAEKKNQLQQQEARAYEQLIIDRFTQLGYCNRWVDSKGNKRIDEVRFEEIHVTADAMFFKIANSIGTAFGGYKTRLPAGVRIYDLVKEETVMELAATCQRQVTAKATVTNGSWIIVHRLDTNDGLLNEVKYTTMMDRYPSMLRPLIPLSMGVTYHRELVWLNLAQFPHMLIAGFTNSGKSNLVNSIICTLITQFSPDEIRLVLVDLKDGIEFSSYEHIPHLHKKVVDSVGVLADRLQELEALMVERNQEMRGKAKTIGHYNAKYPEKQMPRVVCVIDEVASIIAQGENSRRVLNSLGQLTAKGRAAGIHIILSTQRPSVDVIDGRIKVNMAARVVGRMPSHTDSLTVLGTGDAKDLSAVPGRMILQIGPDPIPVQTPFIEESDIADALRRAMDYDAPEPLPVPEDAIVTQGWTPERLVELSLTYLNGNVAHKPVWAEIKDDGNISREQTREMLKRIWAMDCIEYQGKQYHVAPGEGHVKRLVEISQVSELPSS